MKTNLILFLINIFTFQSFLYTLLIVLLILLIYALWILSNKNKDINNSKKIITKLKKEIDIKEETEKRYRLAVEGADGVIWEYDFINREITLSDKWNKLSGEKVNTYIDDDTEDSFFNIIYKLDKEKLIDCIEDIKEQKKKSVNIQFRIINKDKELIWVFLRGIVFNDSKGKPLKIVGSLINITDTKIKEKKIEYIAYHDYLTGLENLKKFMIDIKKYMITWDKKNKKGAIVFIDLDNFKIVNDTLGHEYGDALLKTVALDMCKIIKQNDLGKVYRIAGDEFVIVIEKFKNLQALKKTCEDLISIFNKEIFINNKILNVTCSAGISIYPNHSKDDKQLLINADIAMYKAKQNGKNRYEFFNCNLKEEMNKKIKIEYELNKAMKEKEFILYYQPKINTLTGEIMGYEALIRWYNKNDKCYIKPTEFIPIAERCGIIEELGYWIFEEVCNQINIWESQHIEINQVAVNISPVQLIQRNFVDKLSYILKKHNIDPRKIEIEITETTYMKDIKQNNKILNKLKNIGISIALDDFGTGYSSLSYLVNIPLNTLKIDKSFITGIEEDSVKKQIVQAIIDIAHNINLIVVAEGVEKKEEIDILKEINCDIIQGYYYSKPINGEEVKVFKDSIKRKG